MDKFLLVMWRIIAIVSSICWIVLILSKDTTASTLIMIGVVWILSTVEVRFGELKEKL